MKKNILIITLSLMVVTLAVLFVYRDDILTNISLAEVEENLGRKADFEQLLLFDQDNQRVNATDYLNGGKTVMVYSDNCDPCKQAIADIALAAKQKPQINENFIAITFDSDYPQTFLNYNRLNLFRADGSRGDTIFSGMVTPAFFVFDQQNVLVKRRNGWSKVFVDVFF